MKRIFLRKCIMPVFVLVMVACSVSKNIPDGQYLLDRISLETDSGVIDRDNLMALIQQKPNEPKLGLRIYNIVDNDSTWLKRMVRKLGEPPVIFSERMMNRSFTELSIEVKNLGYLNADVNSTIDTVGRKVRVAYRVHEGAPYRVRNYDIDLGDEDMNSIAKGMRRMNRGSDSVAVRKGGMKRRFFPNGGEPVIKQGEIFNMDILEREMNRVSSRLRNSGYYRLTAENLHYVADTALRSNETDLTMILKDTSAAKIYRIGKVGVFSGFDRMERRYRVADSVMVKDVNVYYDRLHFLRPNVIADKIMVRPGSVYRQRSADATVGLFQSLECINNAQIEYVEGNYGDSTLLDCNVYISPADNHSIRTGLNGTNKAGDLGVALDVNYGNKNLFNGSEHLDIRLKGAYEFVRGQSESYTNRNFFEFGIAPVLTFSEIHLPAVNSLLKGRYNTQTLYSLEFDVQRRPQFQRNFFNFRWQFRWSGRNNIVTQTFSLLDINYAYMPWVSDTFRRFLNTRSGLVTRYSYQDIFTIGSSYGLIYTNANTGRAGQNMYTVRLNVESSGNVIGMFFSMSDRGRSPRGKIFNVFGNPYAQYVKGDIDVAETFPFGNGSSLAFHAGIGVANPYKNSVILPFEKRYYAGGPNNVRGWNTRYLGPGSMRSSSGEDIALHTGDIRFTANAEYRYRALGWFEPAFFVDCGNIWTIRDYVDQPGGRFHWNRFYRELAIGSGLGLRFDFKFLIFRIDAGKRIYDPAMPEGKRFVVAKDSALENWKWYLAIGYPF
jgi:hypothetical protein